jgi:uncharacterized protein (TIGR00299 family) protein
MKTLFIECNMGAAGDMLMSALSELLPEPEKFIDEMNNLRLPNVVLIREKTLKCGVFGTHISVKIKGFEEHSHHYEHSHHHAIGLKEINDTIYSLLVSEKVKKDAVSVYGLIAEAEAKVHGKTSDSVHFHEVGTLDAVADIVGVCRLFELLAPENVVVSPINVGSGQVKCAHGILPVPAPATAYILAGIPSYNSGIKGELCTPTGAALLKHFASKYGNMPVMATEKIGYGMGNKDFEAANCIRVFMGETFEQSGEIAEISCNIDDMTGEELGFALETLMENGALDGSIIPVVMKKSRPGHILLCLCETADEEKFAKLILKFTSTFGVRVKHCNRYILTVRIKRQRREAISPTKPSQ